MTSAQSWPLPADLGFDSDRFPGWRPQQLSAIEACATDNRPCQLLSLPTGIGKTLTYMTLAKLAGGRTVILTATKGLMAQIGREFETLGIHSQAGANEYDCLLLMDEGTLFPNLRRRTCDEGPCRYGFPCGRRNDESCLYYGSVARGTRAELVVTNYDFWMMTQLHGRGFGKVDTLVCDEAHEALDKLTNVLTITIDGSERAFLNLHPPMPFDAKVWKTWATLIAAQLDQKVEQMTAEIKALADPESSSEVVSTTTARSMLRERAHVIRRLRSGAGKLNILSKILSPECYVDISGPIWTIAPLWPGPLAKEFLFFAIPKVILVSATATRSTARYLGWKPEEVNFLEAPTLFSEQRWPIRHIPTIQLTAKTGPTGRKWWLNRIDQILDDRPDRKGIIPSVSYERAQEIFAGSRHADRIWTHAPVDLRSTIASFKAAEPGAVLVSPAVSTGFDFPYRDCEFIIICKVPFPDGRDRYHKARATVDEDYAAYVTVQALMQSIGRGMRADDDRCEVLIIDDNIKWFVWKYKHLFPYWFRSRLRTVNDLPVPPPPLDRGPPRRRFQLTTR